MERLRVLALVCCLVLAGCSAPGIGSLGSSNDDLGNVAANDTLDERHGGALAAATNFSYDANLSTPESSERLDAAIQRDPSVSLTRIVTGPLETTQFSNASGTYIRGEQNGSVAYKYDAGRSRVDGFATAAIPFNATYERNGSTTIDGVPVARFEARNASEDLTLGGYARLGVQNFSATLAVTADGLVKRASWRVDTPAGTYAYNGTYSALGATSVETPEWVSEVNTSDAQE